MHNTPKNGIKITGTIRYLFPFKKCVRIPIQVSTQISR